MSAGKREANSSLELALAMDVWFKLLGRVLPSFGTFSLGASLAVMMGVSVGKTTPADTAR